MFKPLLGIKIKTANGSTIIFLAFSVFKPEYKIKIIIFIFLMFFLYLYSKYYISVIFFIFMLEN
jgi:hypothetical protein